MNDQTDTFAIVEVNPEQLPVPDHELHEWTHFAGLYAGAHVAATISAYWVLQRNEKLNRAST